MPLDQEFMSMKEAKKIAKRLEIGDVFVEEKSEEEE